MSRWVQFICILGTVLVLSGCSMCCGNFDYDFPMFKGGRYMRTDPQHGRVGSIFSDPNAEFGTQAMTNADAPAVPLKVQDSDTLNLDIQNDNAEPSDQEELPNPSLNPNGSTLQTEREQRSIPRWR